MPKNPSSNAGVTLPEILIVLVVAAIILTAAVPRLERSIQSIRVRAALDQVVAELYRARMTAVESGDRVYLDLGSSDGCITRVRLRTDPHPGQGRALNRRLDLPGICLRHSGDSVLVFNARGMLRPPARSVYASDSRTPDSVLISIAGRVRRSY